MNIPPDVLAVSMSMLAIVSFLCCAVINKLDRMTEPNYVRKGKR